MSTINLPLYRTAVLCGTDVVAFIVLGLSAYTLSQVEDFYFTYSALGVATAVIHLCSVTPMIILGTIRDDAFTSKLGVEVAWLSFLWVMWLATGAQAAATLGGVVRCIGSFCGATQAIAAFGFLIWGTLVGYGVTLMTFAIRSAQAGHNVWWTDVQQIRWVQGPVNFNKPNIMVPNITGATYPPGQPGPMGNMGIPVAPQFTGGNPGQFSPITPQGQFYPQQGGTYQV